MKYLPLLWKNLWRKKARTLFTLAGILSAFVLFGVLAAVKLAFSMGVDLTGADRLVTIHKVSIIQPLPVSYGDRIQATPGVVAVAHASWFGGFYQDKRNFFPQFPVDPASYLSMFPEMILSPEQKKAWLEDRQAAIVGRATANQFGFKVGQRIPIMGSPWRRADGSDVWEFNLAGIYDGVEKGTDTTQFLFHYEYFNEARAYGRDLVGWYTVRVEDPERAPQVAEAIDRQFANSPAETKTATEKAFAQAWANQVGNIGLIVEAITGAVFFILLLVAGNTMAQAVRERTGELAVLKTVGFTNGRVMALVLAESLFLAIVGGALGLALSWLVVGAVAKLVGQFLPVFFLPPEAAVQGAGLALLLGFAAGMLPALQAMRLSIVDALRRV
jgi:putative ABC transport system permease protein